MFFCGILSLASKAIDHFQDREYDTQLDALIRIESENHNQIQYSLDKSKVFTAYMDQVIAKIENHPRDPAHIKSVLGEMDALVNAGETGNDKKLNFWYLDDTGQILSPLSHIPHRRFFEKLLRFFRIDSSVYTQITCASTGGNHPDHGKIPSCEYLEKALELQRESQTNTYKLLFGEQSKFNFAQSQSSPYNLEFINFCQRGPHRFLWGRVIDPKLHPGASHVAFYQQPQGILLLIMNWRKFDMPLLQRLMAVTRNNLQDRVRYSYYSLDDGGGMVAPFPPLSETENFFLAATRKGLGRTPAHFRLRDSILFTYPVCSGLTDWRYNQYGDSNQQEYFQFFEEKKIIRGYFVGAVSTLALRAGISGFYDKIRILALLGMVFAALLFFYFQMASFIGIKIKLLLFLFIFIGIPGGYFTYRQLQELKTTRHLMMLEKKNELSQFLKNINEEIVGMEREILLNLCRAFRDSKDFTQLTPAEHQSLWKDIEIRDTFEHVLVYGADLQKLVNFIAVPRGALGAKPSPNQGNDGSSPSASPTTNLAASGPTSGDSSMWDMLVSRIAPYLAGKPLDMKTKFTLDLFQKILDPILKNNFLELLQRLDDFSDFNAGNSVRTIYIDGVEHQGDLKYLVFFVLKRDKFIHDLLLSRTRNQGKREYAFNLYTRDTERQWDPPKILTQKPEWRGGLLDLFNRRFTGILPDGFDPDYLLAIHYIEKYNFLLFAYYPKELVDREIGRREKSIYRDLATAMACLTFLVLFLSYRILSPINQLKAAMHAVETQDYDYQLEIPTKDELADLGNTFNKMLYGLAEKEQLALERAALSRFLSPAVVEEISRDPSKLELGGKTSFLTAFFTDIAGFSSFSELLSPQKLVELLNEYLSEMTLLLLENRGTLDKYEGDAIIAFFGAPIENPCHARDAIATALKMQDRLAHLREKWRREGDKWPEVVKNMRMRIGINSGNILTGNMGSVMQMNYTMMGDAVNLAARLESAGKQYGVGITVAEATLAGCRTEFITRELDQVRVVGRNEPTRIHEILAPASEAPGWKPLLHAYNQGLAHFREGNFPPALEFFERSATLEPHPQKNPSTLYINRCQTIIADPALAPTNMVYSLTEK